MKRLKMIGLSLAVLAIAACSAETEGAQEAADEVDIEETGQDVVGEGNELEGPDLIEEETEVEEAPEADESVSDHPSSEEDAGTPTDGDSLATYSAQEIEYARVWLQLGGNTEELEELYVRQIPAGTEIATEGYFDFSMPVYPEDVIQLTGVRLVDGIVTYSGNGDGTVDLYPIPARFDHSENMSDEEYVTYWEEMITNTESVYIELGNPEDIIRIIETLK